MIDLSRDASIFPELRKETEEEKSKPRLIVEDPQVMALLQSYVDMTTKIYSAEEVLTASMILVLDLIGYHNIPATSALQYFLSAMSIPLVIQKKVNHDGRTIN
jgi:hypothetical protein